MLGTRHSFVIHGPEGLDEVSSTGTTQVFEIAGNILDERTWQPEDFGVEQASAGSLAGGDASDNAKITLDILNGTKGAPRDTVLMNAAAGLIVADRTTSTKMALVLAAQAIDSGCALEILKKLQKNFPIG
jgi:anthranilate phosphoribosyltransferase